MGSRRGALYYIMQLFVKKKLLAIFTLKIQVHFSSTSLLHAELKQIVSFSLFAHYSKAKMKPKFTQVDEGSFIPCSQGFDT